MKLPRPKQRQQCDNSLIPLINVIFLMLIFFMVMGQISPSEAIAVDPPLSAQTATTEIDERVLVLGADGRMAIGGELISAEALEARLATWAGEPASAGLITLKADAAVTSKMLRETLDRLEAAGVEQITLLTLASDRS